MSQSTKRSIPSSLLRKSDGPERPPVVGQSISQPVPLPDITGKVILGAVEIPFLSLEEIKQDDGRKLIAEQLEIKELHMSILNSLSDVSPFRVIGETLLLIASNLSPAGLSVFAPVLSDFRSTAIDSLELPSTLPEVPIRNLIQYVLDLDGKAQQFLLQGAQTILFNEQQSAQSSLVASQTLTNDLTLGYPKLASQLAHTSESIGTHAPRAWNDLAKNLMQRALPQLGTALSGLARTKFTSYSSTSAQIYSAHQHLRQASDLKTKIQSNLGYFTLQVHTIEQAIRASQSGGAVSIDQLEKQILRQSKDILHREVSKQLSRLEKYLKSKIQRQASKHDASKNAVLKYLESPPPSSGTNNSASKSDSTQVVSAQGTGSESQST